MARVEAAEMEAQEHRGARALERHDVPVLVSVAVDQPYTYEWVGTPPPPPGSFVRVPLGPREAVGVVWHRPAPTPDKAVRLRPIGRLYDAPPLTSAMLDFIAWLADYTFSSLGMVLRMVLREDALGPERAVPGVRLVGAPPLRMTPPRRRALDALAQETLPKAALAAAAGVSPAIVDGLVKAGTLERVGLPPPPVAAPLDAAHSAPALNAEQAAAANGLDASLGEGFGVTLLDGVTGSGKTEVYFETVAKALEEGRQVLILLPEIALTTAFLDRFMARFGGHPAEWHSDVTEAQKARIWRGVAAGEVRVVAGARSALFLPFADLGLVVVDEEHDQAYKQGDRVIYNARDMAVLRARFEGAPVVLSSATPSVETRVNADRGRYRRVLLENRFSGAAVPKAEIIDMREEGPEPGTWIAPRLSAAVEETVERGEQALLFLNRRGYAPLTLCRACGHRFQCPNCSAWLVEHRFRGKLVCHHCDHAERQPEACPSCRAVGSLVPCGPGVERLAEEVVTRFPHARTIILSSDMTGSLAHLRAELDAIADGDVDIVIGTQLVAKGHDFPKLSLVGVVDADLGLSYADPRASERTFQMLTQVTGRAGRRGQEARALLQSYEPDHPVIAALVAGDREAFYASEIEVRRRGLLPPFGRLTALIVSATKRDLAQWHARALARAAPDMEGVRLLGPAEAPLSVIRGRYRYRLLVQSETAGRMQTYLRAWFAAAPEAKGSTRVQVDVDPQSFM